MKLIKKTVAVAGAVAMLVSVAACGSNSGSNEGTPENPITLNVWAWGSTLKSVAKRFEEKNPNIKVKITNVGSSTKEYTSLQNALSAGKGAPDVAQIEYYAIPQFQMSNNLYNLKKFGADKFSDYYLPGPWASVSNNGGVWGMPLDSAPTAFFYNKSVLDKAGVTEVPKTWDEFYEAAKKVRATGSYILSDPTNISVDEAWIWAAGGKPVKNHGDNKLTINYADDAKVKDFSKLMQKMIDEDLIDTKLNMWSDDWYKALNNGTLCGMTAGAWMVIILKQSIKESAGQWRIADMPQYDLNNFGNGEDGGSSLAVLAKTDKAEAAYKFAKFASYDRDGIEIGSKMGQFPSDTKTLNDPSFVNKTDSYFGDQKYQDVLIKAAKKVRPGWTFLPYEAYGRNNFPDFSGKASTDKTITFQKSIEEWQADLVKYGNGQGFTVNK